MVNEKQIYNSNYHDIYIRQLELHCNDYDFCISPRGFTTYEKMATGFTLTNPIERVVYSEERRPNIVFLFAEALWYLKGDNHLDFISYYAPSIEKYSANGETLEGTAYGTRIFSYNNSLNQWERLINEFNDDRDTRRGVIAIFNPAELNPKNIDVACTLSLQFLIRSNKLSLITSMRSNDIYLGGLSDVFSFTFLQELLANELGVDVGYYYHRVGSSHIYKKDLIRAKKIIELRKKYDGYKLSFPHMPNGNNWEYIRTVLRLEEAIRKNTGNEQVLQLKETLPKYWFDIVTLLELYSQYKRLNVVNEKLLKSLDDTLQYLANVYFVKK